jgi:hypothetical protein
MVKTQYNSCGEGWELCGNFSVDLVGYLLGRVVFTCDVFFDLCLLSVVSHQVADQWLSSG